MELLQLQGNARAYGDEHLTVDFERRRVALDGEHMALTRKEYELLSVLTSHAGTIVPRSALLREIWGYGPEIRTRTLDVHIRRLRRKLGGYAGRYIETVFRIGYRFQPYRAEGLLDANSSALALTA
jgi:two-component system phosphate regulon response regulator PhoB